jgi:hypothetical protein
MRKEKIVTITTENRDRGKMFRLVEMPADQGEKWAFRALLALSRGGMQLPAGIFDAGMPGLASVVPYLVIVGLRSLHAATWAELEPLLDEMMLCVKYQPPQSGVPAQDLIGGANGQIEEIRTRVMLRQEILELHVDPSLAAVLQSSDQPSDPAKEPAAKATSNT